MLRPKAPSNFAIAAHGVKPAPWPQREEGRDTNFSLSALLIQLFRKAAVFLLQGWKGVGDRVLSSHIWPHRAPAVPLASVTV